MANIYQIRQEIAEFEPECDPETGEITNALSWDALNMAFEEKVENIACYIKNLTGDIKDFKAEEEQLAKRRRSMEKKVEYLKRLLVDNMDGQKFSTTRCAVSFRKSVQVEIQDEGLVPQELMVQTVTFKPDKVAIKELLKSGQQVSGCCLVENMNPQIK